MKEILNMSTLHPLSRVRNVYWKILSALSSGLYYTNIRMFETYATVNQKFTNTFNVLHDRWAISDQ